MFKDAVEFAHHLALVPEEALQILHPFEVGDDHAACIAENVGDHKNLRTLGDDRIRLRRGRAVRAFGKNAALDFRGVIACDLTLHGGRNQYIAGREQELLVGDRVSTIESDDTPRFGHIFIEFHQINPVRIVQTTERIAHSDHFESHAGQRRCRDGTHIAVALHHRCCALRRDAHGVHRA